VCRIYVNKYPVYIEVNGREVPPGITWPDSMAAIDEASLDIDV
jgi:hypothetical protein